MAMNYVSLIGDKSTAGSVMSWVNYSKLPSPTIVDEAQALLYSMLRTREMMVDLAFTMTAGTAHLALPTGFLDAIGRIRFTTIPGVGRHKDSGTIQGRRIYSNTTGALGAGPFTTVSGSALVTVNLTGHGFNQDSVFYCAGAAAVGGITPNGTFPIVSITDADNFVIDITSLGTLPSSSGSGGGSAVTYSCDNLVSGFPQFFGIWNETIYFDQAFNQQTSGLLQYYRSLPLLSASNTNNFLTNRYPQLLRRACVAMAADFMKDSEEYQKDVAALSAMVQQINVENDGQMRGIELEAENP